MALKAGTNDYITVKSTDGRDKAYHLVIIKDAAASTTGVLSVKAAFEFNPNERIRDTLGKPIWSGQYKDLSAMKRSGIFIIAGDYHRKKYISR